MEVAGLAVSILSLFNTAVEGFERIQSAKNFDRDFQTCCLQLNNTQLRLSRWGKAVGLDGGLGEITSLETQYPDDTRHADKLLRQIVDLFQQAEEASNKFKDRHGQVDNSRIQDELTGDQR